MDESEALTQLRSAIVRGDHVELLALLRGQGRPARSLQLIGDGLLEALRADNQEAAALARECVGELGERDWVGDQELAEVLTAALGDGPVPMLRLLPVDLEELSMILEGDPVQGGGRIEPSTGEVWPQSVVEYGVEIGEIEEEDDDPDRWLWVNTAGSRPGYRDMEWFIEDLDDRGEAELAGHLARAISGRGAFRRFKDRLAERPEQMALWYSFSNDRQRGRARSWLAVQGYTPIRAKGPSS